MDSATPSSAANHSRTHSASSSAQSMEEVFGIHFVVRKTFVELDEEPTLLEKCCSLGRRPRALTEPPPCTASEVEIEDSEETQSATEHVFGHFRDRSSGSTSTTVTAVSSQGGGASLDIAGHSPQEQSSAGHLGWEETPVSMNEPSSPGPNFCFNGFVPLSSYNATLASTFVVVDPSLQAGAEACAQAMMAPPGNFSVAQQSAGEYVHDWQPAEVNDRQRPRGKYDGRTTLMLRNIPNDYSRDMVVELLDSQGFATRYDFIYLPVDFKRMAGLGYAFVNCTSHADAEEMMAIFQGFRHWRFNSAKTCEVVWGEPLQGLQAHIDRYRNSPVMHGSVPDGCKPAVFQNGVRYPFPAPTKRIRLPRH